MMTTEDLAKEFEKWLDDHFCGGINTPEEFGFLSCKMTAIALQAKRQALKEAADCLKRWGYDKQIQQVILALMEED